VGNTVFFETIIQTKGSSYIILIIIIILSVLLLIGLLIGIIHAVKNTSIAINDNNVIIKSFLYGRKIPIQDIKINETRMINLNQESEFNISVRTNGIGLPNFYSGWMRLKNGQKALVFLTDREKVLLMPVNDFIILFSMERGEEFIKRLPLTQNPRQPSD